MRAEGSCEKAPARNAPSENAPLERRTALLSGSTPASWSQVARMSSVLVVDHQQVHVGDCPRAGDALLAPVERHARLVAAADHYQRAAALEAEQRLARKQEHRLARAAPGERVRAALGALDRGRFGELGEPLGREPRQGRELGKLLRGGLQNSSTRLFCSMRGRKSPAHSSISSMVGSISPGLRWVM